MFARPIPDSALDALRYDPGTGHFHYVTPRKLAGKRAGTINHKGYVIIGHARRKYMAHRLAWYFVHGEQPEIIDHINHNPSDNRIANLRNVTNAENLLNMCKQPGVNWVRFADRHGRLAYRYVQARYRSRTIYTGKSILLAWYHRIMAERADHPIGLPSP